MNESHLRAIQLDLSDIVNKSNDIHYLLLHDRDDEPNTELVLEARKLRSIATKVYTVVSKKIEEKMEEKT